jgi:hypothetical protein
MSLTQLTNLQKELELINETLAIFHQNNYKPNYYVNSLIDRKAKILSQF